jgi:hypothetical protein
MGVLAVDYVLGEAEIFGDDICATVRNEGMKDGRGT